jgi:hypothetical protein
VIEGDRTDLHDNVGETPLCGAHDLAIPVRGGVVELAAVANTTLS